MPIRPNITDKGVIFKIATPENNYISESRVVKLTYKSHFLAARGLNCDEIDDFTEDNKTNRLDN